MADIVVASQEPSKERRSCKILPQIMGGRTNIADVCRTPFRWGVSGCSKRGATKGMIDNYIEAMEIVRKMNAQLPIPACPTTTFIHAMSDNGIKVTSDQNLQIESVLYLADEGGIGCAVRLSEQQENPIIASLTHIRVKASHPLAKEIEAYQIERTRKLAQANRHRQPTQFTVKPRRKRKKR